MKFLPVMPIGERKVAVLVHGRLEWVVEPIYPPSPQGKSLRTKRVEGEPYLTLREASKRLRIKPSELSYLETGQLIADDWPEVFRLLRPEGGSES